MKASKLKQLEMVKSLIGSDSIKINDLISGKTFTAQDVKTIRIDGDVVEMEVCDKEILLVVDDEIMSCFSQNELELIQTELEMEFPFAVISIHEGAEHTISTRGLNSQELDLVTYNIRRIFEETIARLND